MRKLFFALCCIALVSCEKEIEFDNEDTEPKLVVNGVFQSDSVWSVHVSYSLNVLDQADITYLSNASVKLKDGNGNLIEDLVHQGEGYYVSPSGFQPVIGNAYRVEVSHPNYPTVNALSSQPFPVAFAVTDTLTISTTYDDFLQVNFSLPDPGVLGNRYEVRAYAYNENIYYDSWGNPIDTVITIDPLTLSSNSVYFENGDGGERYTNRLFSLDDVYNGQTTDFVVNVHLWSAAYNSPIYLVVNHCSEEYYRFSYSYQKYTETAGDPFAQPVQVYSNVENGIGVFGGFSPFIVQVR